jgi:hypothetical protein
VRVKIAVEYEKPQLVNQSGGALERARRAAKRRKYEEKEMDKSIATIGLATKLTPITDRRSARPTIERLLVQLRERNINAIQNGSGFVLRTILSADLNIAYHTPLSGSSYIPRPDFLQRKQCIINARNKANRCYGYPILAALLQHNIQGNRPRAAHYDAYFAQYGLEGMGLSSEDRGP